MRPHPTVFEPGYFSGFNRDLECLKSIADFVDLATDASRYLLALDSEHSALLPTHSSAGIFDPCERLKKAWTSDDQLREPVFLDCELTKTQKVLVLGALQIGRTLGLLWNTFAGS